MTVKEFKKVQKINYVTGIIGAIICIWGLTNASYNKGVVAGASKVLEHEQTSCDDKK